MNSYITAEEREAILDDGLFAVGPPVLIGGVSRTQFSIARYYSEIMLNGYQYTYMHDTDELIRDDLLKWLKKQRESEAKAAKVCESQKAFDESQRKLWLAADTQKDLF